MGRQNTVPATNAVVRKMLALSSQIPKLPDKRKKEAKDLQKKIQGMKDNFGVGKKMFDMVTEREYAH